LHQTREFIPRRARDLAQQRRIIGKIDRQADKFAVVDGVRLPLQHFLQFLLADAGRPDGMGSRDVFGHVANHFDAVVNVFVEKISAELRIEKLGSKSGPDNDEHDRDDCDEQVRDDQAVAQTPQELVSPPADEAVEQVDESAKGEEFREAVKATLKTQKRDGHTGS
jgi:hypothetical protein